MADRVLIYFSGSHAEFSCPVTANEIIRNIFLPQDAGGLLSCSRDGRAISEDTLFQGDEWLPSNCSYVLISKGNLSYFVLLFIF